MEHPRHFAPARGLPGGNVVQLRPRRRPRLRANPVHELACDCPRCAPRPPLTGSQIALRIIAGVPIGLVLAKAIDWSVGGPGVLAMFGAWS